MSLLGRIMALFPAFAILADLAAIAAFVVRPCVVTGLAIPVAIYLLPLLTFRLLSLFHPLRPGNTPIASPVYSPWWGAHQCQVLFDAFPGLEMPFKLTPLLYPMWLRAWGSRVGRNVYFTPSFRPLDRGLLSIGDGVIFGHDIECSGHLITRSKGELVLIVDRVTFEDGAFIGSGARIAPGVVIGARARVGIYVRIAPHVQVAPGTKVPPETTLWGDDRTSGPREPGDGGATS